MTEPVERATPPLRTWRPMAAWTGAILLALGLAWFVGAVVVPYIGTRKAVTELADLESKHQIAWDRDKLVDGLGGSVPTARKLDMYSYLPVWLAPHRKHAAFLLGGCGRPAVKPLARLLRDEDPQVRWRAANSLCGLGVDAKDAIPALITALDDADWGVCALSANALGQIGPDAREAEGPLVRLLKDRSNEPLARVLYPALEKIRGVIPAGTVVPQLGEDHRSTTGEERRLPR